MIKIFLEKAKTFHAFQEAIRPNKNFIASIIIVNWEHVAIKLTIDFASNVKISLNKKNRLVGIESL